VIWTDLENQDTGNSEILSYNLFWDTGTGLSDIELTDSLVTDFTVTGLSGGFNYKFKVRARNVYGYGDFSTEYVVEATDMPGKPPIPTVELQGTDVIVTW
jgi:hypothetical protein